MIAPSAFDHRTEFELDSYRMKIEQGASDCRSIHSPHAGILLEGKFVLFLSLLLLLYQPFDQFFRASASERLFFFRSVDAKRQVRFL